MRVQLGSWAPDAPIYEVPTLINVRNAIQARGRWLAQPGLGALSSQTMTAPIQGLFSATRLTGDIEAFVGFGGELYRIPGREDALVNVSDPELSGSYDPAETARWRVVQFGDFLVATNWLDEVQGYDLLEGGTFLPLGDASDEVPRFKYPAVVKEILVGAYTFDDVDGENGYQVRWSGIVNGIPQVNSWERSANTQADSKNFSDIGTITGLTGGEFGTVIGDSGVGRMSFGELLFRFDTVEKRIGSRVPNSVIQYRSLTFFWSPEGWAAFDGSAVRLIGVEKIDRWFAADFDEAYAHKMWSAVESGRGHVLWAYCGAGHNGEPNRLLRYSVALDEWAVSDFALQALSSGKTFALSLDDSFFDDLDSFTGSLDDPSLWNSYPQTVVISDNTLQAFIGQPLEGQFEISEFQAGGELNRSILRRVMVRGQGGTSTISLFSRDRFDEVGQWSSAFGQQADGWIRFRVPGRSHRSRLVRGGSWVDAESIVLVGDGLGQR